MESKNDYWMKTTRLGNKGEKLVRDILTKIGFNITQPTSNNSKWDCKAELDGLVKTFEVKTQDRCAEYGGFSVEIGNKALGNYQHKLDNPDFIWEGYKCAYTGLSVSQADYQVFTDGKYVAYFVLTEALEQWLNDVITREKHRITWGGYKRRSLQVQVKLEEICELTSIKKYFFKNKGKKSEIQLALEQKGLYIQSK